MNCRACGRSAIGKKAAESGWKNHGIDHESAASRVPNRNIRPRIATAIAKPKRANTVNMSTRFARPTSNTLKSKNQAESTMPRISRMSAFMHPDAKSASTYSLTFSGAINMLLKFLDQIFHILPTATEYDVIAMICHKSIPKKTYRAASTCSLPARYTEMRPKITILMSGRTNTSTITTKEWKVMYNSCINTPRTCRHFIYVFALSVEIHPRASV